MVFQLFISTTIFQFKLILTEKKERKKKKSLGTGKFKWWSHLTQFKPETMPREIDPAAISRTWKQLTESDGRTDGPSIRYPYGARHLMSVSLSCYLPRREFSFSWTFQHITQPHMFISSPASSQLTSSSVYRVRMQTTAGGPFSWESAINTYTHVALLRERRRRRGAKEISKGETTGWFCCLLSSCKVKPFVTHLPTTLYRLLLWNHTHNVTTQQSETSLSLSLYVCVHYRYKHKIYCCH